MNIQNDLTNKISDKIKPYEKERIERLSKLFIREFFVFIVLFFLVKSFIICINNSDAAFWFMVMILGVIYYIFYDFIHTNKLFKDLIKSECSNIVSDFVKKSSNPISKKVIKKSNLFGYFEDVNVDDGFCGTYNLVRYDIQETILSGKSSKGFNITVFNGLIILFDFNKVILEDTIISRKYDDNIKQNMHLANLKRIFIPLTIIWLVIECPFAYMDFCKGRFDFETLLMLITPLIFWLLAFGLPMLIAHIIQQRKLKMGKTEMEDIVFGKDYIVRTKDPVEARYYITTAFIERYLKLQKKFKTKNIKCSFFDNKIMFAIPTRRDMFEFCNLFVSLNNRKYIEKFYEDINEIITMIDLFKLDERTGL